MTAEVTEPARVPGPPGFRPTPLTIAAGGGYAARLVLVDGADRWCPERWTLDGPEPYAVRLPGTQPEDPGSELMPLADGRVLIGRRADGRHHFSLLYPSGPETGELPLGAVESEVLTLLPPAPDGARVYALARQEETTALWLVCGGAFGPELVAVLAGRCSGGSWLDVSGRLLALDRTDADGRTRTVTVDVEHGGEPAELLRIAEDSNDRLLLADPDSGLLLVRSDAPGADRIGWGVLGSQSPVRFPEALHPENVTVTPFALQPGQVLMPEACSVALRMTTASADWVALWQPRQRELRHLAAPDGWLPGTGRLTTDGWLLLPYSTAAVPCGLARSAAPEPEPEPAAPASRSTASTDLTGADVTGTDVTGADLTGTDVTGTDLTGTDVTGADVTAEPPVAASEPAGAATAPEPEAVVAAPTPQDLAPPAPTPTPPSPPGPDRAYEAPAAAPPARVTSVAKPVPLQQAPLARVG